MRRDVVSAVAKGEFNEDDRGVVRFEGFEKRDWSRGRLAGHGLFLSLSCRRRGILIKESGNLSCNFFLMNGVYFSLKWAVCVSSLFFLSCSLIMFAMSRPLFWWKDTTKIHIVEKCMSNNAYLLSWSSFSLNPIYVRDFLTSLTQPPVVSSPLRSYIHARSCLFRPCCVWFRAAIHYPGALSSRWAWHARLFLGLSLSPSVDVKLHFHYGVNLSY